MDEDSDIPVITPEKDQIGGIDPDEMFPGPPDGGGDIPAEATYRPSRLRVFFQDGTQRDFYTDQIEPAEGMVVLNKITGAKVTRMLGQEAGVHFETTTTDIIPVTYVKHIEVTELDEETIEVVN